MRLLKLSDLTVGIFFPSLANVATLWVSAIAQERKYTQSVAEPSAERNPDTLISRAIYIIVA